jgi:hypothetical protein
MTSILIFSITRITWRWPLVWAEACRDWKEHKINTHFISCCERRFYLVVWRGISMKYMCSYGWEGSWEFPSFEFVLQLCQALNMLLISANWENYIRMSKIGGREFKPQSTIYSNRKQSPVREYWSSLCPFASNER